MKPKKNCNCLFCKSKCQKCGSINIEVEFNPKYHYKNDKPNEIQIVLKENNTLVKCLDCGTVSKPSKNLNNAIFDGLYLHNHYKIRPHDPRYAVIFHVEDYIVEKEEMKSMNEDDLSDVIDKANSYLEEFNEQIWNALEVLTEKTGKEFVTKKIVKKIEAPEHIATVEGGTLDIWNKTINEDLYMEWLEERRA